jgi:TPP-dependent pyruvate/acetoin dehydrogenase alpha subunit
LLEKAGEWTREWQSEMEANASQAIEDAVEWAESVPEPTLDEMLGRMFEGEAQMMSEEFARDD